MATTTLTNGTKIPERASRDWYSDLSTNWYLLDNHLGDTGSHLDDGLAPKATADASGNTITSTYATKTELSTLSTTVGTKANDTDVVHKADTETITGAKTFSATVTSADVVPSATDTYSLGSASYQYNGIYGKSYYYNGTQWGLDQANTWTANQSFSKNIRVDSITGISDCAMAFTGLYNTIFFNTRGSSNFKSYGTFFSASYSNSSPAPNRYGVLALYRSTDKYGDTNDGYIPDPSFALWRVMPAYLTVDITENVRFSNYDSDNYLAPITNNATDLGTSTYKWKTLNGINPGALSLPDLGSDGYIDLSGNISANTTYSYTPTVDGWLALYVQTSSFHAENAVGIFTGSGSVYRWAWSVTSAINLPRESSYHGAVMLPVKAGIPYLCWMTINSSTTLSSTKLYFYKATGNV